MGCVVSWTALVLLIAPYMRKGGCRGLPFPDEVLLRIHFIPQWLTLSDQAMEEALHEVPLFQDFAGLGG